jgi:tetratricopeptide (TPR) repeat protein
MKNITQNWLARYAKTSFRTWLIWRSQQRNKAAIQHLTSLLLRAIAYGEHYLPIKWRAQCWSWLGCYEEALKIYRDASPPIERINLRLMAACGMTDELKLRAKELDTYDEKKKAAASIMAFDPDLACKLFSQLDPCILHAAALSTLERHAEGRMILEASKLQKNYDGNLSLLKANFSLLDPLEAINKCLHSERLGTLEKVNEWSQGALSFKAGAVKPINEGPRVTVIVAAYNTSEYIDRSIRSLLKQTWQNIEVIAVDDASGDDTLARLRRISKQDQRVKIIHQSINQGPYSARMKALQVASGKFVTCHDSDDWAHPQRIERQIKPLLENQRLIATTSSWVRMTADDKFYVKKSWPLIHHNPASPMFRKDVVLSSIGGFDTVRAGADSEFFERLKVAFGTSRIKQVNGILTLGSHRSNSITNSLETGVINFKPSHSRLAYWEAWRHWHINCIRRGITPKMTETGPRPFEAPVDILNRYQQ